MYALIINGYVHDLFVKDPHLGPHLTVVDVTDVPDIAQGWVAHADGTYSAPTYFTPAPAPGATTLTPAQARIQLFRTPGSAPGKTLLDDVTAAVTAAGGQIAIWFAEALSWDRHSPYVAAIGKTLKLSAEQIDSLFASAAKIEV